MQDAARGFSVQLPSVGDESELIIRVSRGSGVGRTRLSAFDAALQDAGVADFNLVRLSSVIPAASQVLEVQGEEQLKGEHGDLLYCVYADAYTSTPGEEAWAGVAWAHHQDGSGAGLFVEHHGLSYSDVSTELKHSLEDLSTIRGGHYQPTNSVLSSATCLDHPVCAVVVATYRRAGWGTA